MKSIFQWPSWAKWSIAIFMMVVIYLLSVAQAANAQCKAWIREGAAGFSADVAENVSLAMDGAGQPYTAYRDDGNSFKATVMKYNGSSWGVVGAAGFSAGSAWGTQIKIDNSNVPYVAYADESIGHKLCVRKYNGSSWVSVGGDGFSPAGMYLFTSGFSYENPTSFSLALDGTGAPYVVFRDSTQSGKLTVKKYNGTSWVTVGTAGFTAGAATQQSIAIHNSTGDVFVSFADVSSGQLSVMKFNGTAWSIVGSAGFIPGGVTQTNVAVNSAGQPYVSFQVTYTGSGLYTGLYVYTFSGGSWSRVGSTSVASNFATFNNLIIGPYDVPYMGYIGDFYGLTTFLNRPTVKKYNGDYWEEVGQRGFSTSDAGELGMAIDAGGTIWTVYGDESLDWKLVGKKLQNVSTTITGTASICIGAATTLSHSQVDGVWTSLAPAIAAVGSATGVVTAAGGGVAQIRYTIGNCNAFKDVSVNPYPGEISGPLFVTAGSAITLSNSLTGGTWSVSNANATINSSGVLTGISAGTTTVSYAISGSCGVTYSTRTETIDPSSPACRAWSLAGAAEFATYISRRNLVMNASGVPYVGYVDYFVGNRPVVKKYNGADWETVGTEGLGVSTNAYDFSLTASPTGELYAAGTFWDEPGHAKTFQYSGGTWHVMAGPPVPAYLGDYTDELYQPTVATDASGVLYEAGLWWDYDGGYETNIMVGSYNGSSWDMLSSPGIAHLTSMQFAVGGSTPYVCFQDELNSNKLTVKKYNGTSWELVGVAGFYTGAFDAFFFSVNGSGTPYISFNAPSTGIPTVMKFDGTGWVNVGGAIDGIHIASLSLDNSGTPYLVGYPTGIDYGAFVIAKFDGTSWQNIGLNRQDAAEPLLVADNAGNIFVALNDYNTTGPKLTITKLTATASAPPIAGPSSICSAAGELFSNDLGPLGEWNTSNSLVANPLWANDGTFYGLSAGTFTISYVNGTCAATKNVTVAPNVAWISGRYTVNTGATTTLTTNISGGTWSVSNSNATISSTGVVTGVTAGTVVVSYIVTGPCGPSFPTLVMNVVSGTPCNTWSLVGTTGFTSGSATELALNVDNGGIPYVMATGDDYYGRKFNGSSWTPISDFSGAITGHPLIEFDSYNTAFLFVNDIVSKQTGALGTWTAGNSPIISPSPLSMAVDNTDFPYVAHTNASTGALLVEKFIGSYDYTGSVYMWSDMGAVSAGAVGELSMKFSNDNMLYVAYVDVANGNKVTVQKYNGSAWSIVGSAGFTSGSASNLKLAISNDGTPYVGYSDLSNSNVAMVMKYNGSAWVVVGGSAISAGGTNYNSLALDNAGVPYVAYQDATASSKVTAKKFNGTSWETLGSVGFSDGVASKVAISVSAANDAFVAYIDGAHSNKATVMRYSTGSLSPITGSATVCVSSTTTLANAEAGGTWSSSNVAIATVGSTNGVVTGMADGTVTISYVTGSCYATTVVTVGVSGGLSAITGAGTVCAGSTTTLGNAATGGTWSSSNTSVAAVGSATGIVSGVAAGNATITYAVTGGCGTASVTKVVTVNAGPSAGTITGTATVCTGNTTTLNNATTGGTWNSSNTSVATVGSATGIVSGVAAGNATITYSVVSGCGTATTTAVVTVNATPSAGSITGAATVCAGNTTTLNNAISGGTWSSSNTSIATVGSATGIVNGVAAGNVTITYTITSSCGSATATRSVTVNVATSAGTITGAGAICISATTTLSNPVSGGTWSSSDGAVATVGSATGVVSGVSSGNATITYTVTGTCGTANATAVVTVGATAPITGSLALCAGMTSTLSGGSTGGVWSSSNTAVATIGAANGILTAVSTGTSNITYSTGSGCTATAVVSVSAPALIAGTSNACVGQVATLTDATTGGVWSSSNTSLATIDASTGVVTGIAAGTTTVSYVVSAGCYRTITFTVKALPPAIAGPVTVCAGATAYVPPPSTTGYSWTSSNTSVAVIGSSTGMLTGVAAGTTTLTYTTNTGCFVTTEATVNTAPASITGTTALCSGTTSTLSSVTPGGVWSSSNTSVAAIGSATGAFTAGSAGTATISYTVGGCRTASVVTVSAIAAITGTPSACVGSSTTLNNTSAGGTWSSSNTSIATVGTSGVLTGVAAGNASITYTLSTGCIRTVTATVVATPAGITGTLSICPSTTATLSGGTAGGTWSGGNASIATINSTTGVLSGIGAGTINVSYTLTGCRVTAIATVNPLPAVITGTINACVAQTSMLNNATAGGAWSSANTGVATVDPSTGVVTGVSAATTTMTYTLGTGCYRTIPFTVKALPPAITASVAACVGTTTYVAPPSTNGKSWSSSNASVATMGSSTGIMTGVSTGTTILTYTATTGCYVTTEATVYALPNAGTITGPTSVIVGNTITLNDAAGGGVWSSGNVARATIGSATGVVTGVAGGTATMSYSVSNPGCTVRATQVISVLTSRPGDNGQVAVSGMQLYPNPTTGAFTVEVEEAGTFSIFSLDGKEIHKYNINTGVTQLTLSNQLASGIYMCRFTSESGNTTMVRLVYER